MEDEAPRREPAFFDSHRFRRKMSEMGITQDDLAAVSGIDQRNISAILAGKQYLGKMRRDRLQDALHQLALEAEARKREAEASGEEATPTPEPRVRRL